MIRLFFSIVTGIAYIISVSLLLVIGSSWALDLAHGWNRLHTKVSALDPDALRTVHPDLSRQEISDMLEETYFGDGMFVYEPYLTRKERPRNGRFVTVSPQGFRGTGRPHLTLADNSVKRICLFGGSTVFGYGVDDRNTLAGHLQRMVDQRRPNERWAVFNFGRATYFLEQEGVQFQLLAERGVHCQVAVFLDGSAEEANKEPAGAPDLGHLFHTYYYDRRQLVIDLVRSATLERLMNHVAPVADAPVDSPSDVSRRYVSARTMVRATNGLAQAKLIFALIPAAGYRNSWFNNPYKEEHCTGNSCADSLRITMDKLVAETSQDADSHDLTGLFKNWSTTPFLDSAHYTPAANKAVAQSVYGLIFPGEPDFAAASGRL